LDHEKGHISRRLEVGPFLFMKILLKRIIGGILVGCLLISPDTAWAFSGFTQGRVAHSPAGPRPFDSQALTLALALSVWTGLGLRQDSPPFLHSYRQWPRSLASRKKDDPPESPETARVLEYERLQAEWDRLRSKIQALPPEDSRLPILAQILLEIQRLQAPPPPSKSSDLMAPALAAWGREIHQMEVASLADLLRSGVSELLHSALFAEFVAAPPLQSTLSPPVPVSPSGSLSASGEPLTLLERLLELEAEEKRVYARDLDDSHLLDWADILRNLKRGADVHAVWQAMYDQEFKLPRERRSPFQRHLGNLRDGVDYFPKARGDMYVLFQQAVRIRLDRVERVLEERGLLQPSQSSEPDESMADADPLTHQWRRLENRMRALTASDVRIVFLRSLLEGILQKKVPVPPPHTKDAFIMDIAKWGREFLETKRRFPRSEVLRSIQRLLTTEPLRESGMDRSDAIRAVWDEIVRMLKHWKIKDPRWGRVEAILYAIRNNRAAVVEAEIGTNPSLAVFRRFAGLLALERQYASLLMRKWNHRLTRWLHQEPFAGYVPPTADELDGRNGSPSSTAAGRSLPNVGTLRDWIQVLDLWDQAWEFERALGMGEQALQEWLPEVRRKFSKSRLRSRGVPIQFHAQFDRLQQIGESMMDQTHEERRTSLMHLRQLSDGYRAVAQKAIESHPHMKKSGVTAPGQIGQLWLPLLQKVDPQAKDQVAAAAVFAAAGLVEGGLVGWAIHFTWSYPEPTIAATLALGFVLHALFGVILLDQRGWYVKGWKLDKFSSSSMASATAAFSSSLLALWFAPTSSLLVTILAGAIPHAAINLLYLIRRIPPVIKEMAGAIVIYVALTTLWEFALPTVLIGPRWELMKVLPIAMFAGVVSGIFSDRVGTKGKGRPDYTWKRFKALGVQILGFVALSVLYSAPVEWSVIYSWWLPMIPGPSWVPAVVDSFILSPLVVDPLAYYLGKRIFIPMEERVGFFSLESRRRSMQSLRTNLAEFYLLSLPGWFLSVLGTMYLTNPILSFTALSAGIIWWNLVYARAMRPDFKGLPAWIQQKAWMQAWIALLQRLNNWMGLENYIRIMIGTLYFISVGRHLVLWDAPELYRQLWTGVGLAGVAGWVLYRIRSGWIARRSDHRNLQREVQEILEESSQQRPQETVESILKRVEVAAERGGLAEAGPLIEVLEQVIVFYDIVEREKRTVQIADLEHVVEELTQAYAFRPDDLQIIRWAIGLDQHPDMVWTERLRHLLKWEHGSLNLPTAESENHLPLSSEKSGAVVQEPASDESDEWVRVLILGPADSILLGNVKNALSRLQEAYALSGADVTWVRTEEEAMDAYDQAHLEGAAFNLVVLDGIYPGMYTHIRDDEWDHERDLISHGVVPILQFRPLRAGQSPSDIPVGLHVVDNNTVRMEHLSDILPALLKLHPLMSGEPGDEQAAFANSPWPVLFTALGIPAWGWHALILGSLMMAGILGFRIWRHRSPVTRSTPHSIKVAA
jgi:hypothetical protein